MKIRANLRNQWKKCRIKVFSTDFSRNAVGMQSEKRHWGLHLCGRTPQSLWLHDCA